MNNYTINIYHTIDTFNDELLKMIHIKITIIQGKFSIRALPEIISVTLGTIRVSSFKCNISGNQKEMNASFTTNAFTVFTGNVNIEFGYGGEIIGVFENFDIINNITPLDPIFSGIVAPNADNLWLQNLINNQ